MSFEKDMGRAFELIRSGHDPYRAFAAERFEKNYHEVTDEERFTMKCRMMIALAGSEKLSEYEHNHKISEIV